MTKALALARSFHARGPPGGAGRVGASTGSPGTGSPARSTPSTSCPNPARPATPTRCATSCGAEGVDVWVPVCSPAASWYDAVASRCSPRSARCIHPDPECCAPSTTRPRSPRPRPRSACPCPTPTASRAGAGRVLRLRADPGPGSSRASPTTPSSRLDLTPLPRPTPAETADFARSKPISADTPVDPAGVHRRGRSTARTAPRGTAAAGLRLLRSSAFQLNYAMVDKPEIEEWVRRFVDALRVTGQLLVRLHRGRRRHAVALECNPRTHSAITMFHRDPGLARAYLEDASIPASRPTPAGSRPTYWLYHELWRMSPVRRRAASASGDPPRHRRGLRPRRPAAVPPAAPPADPVAAAGEPVRRKGWIRIDFNIGKLVEPAGDLWMRVLHLAGSAVSDFFADLSRLYAADCLEATAGVQPRQLGVELVDGGADEVQHVPSFSRPPVSTSLPMLKSIRVQPAPRRRLATSSDGICRWWTMKYGNGSHHAKMASVPRGSSRALAAPSSAGSAVARARGRSSRSGGHSGRGVIDRVPRRRGRPRPTSGWS